MKILVYGSPRTRSSYLLDVLCQNYNLANYFEPYGIQMVDEIKTRIPFHKLHIELWDAFKQKTKDMTLALSKQDNFGCKFFSGNLVNWVNYTPNVLNPNPDYTKLTKDEFIDAFDFHGINMYDQIFFTYRENLADQYCSYQHAEQHSTFLFKQGQEKLAKIYAPKSKAITYTYFDLKFWVFSAIVFDVFTEQIIKRKNNVTVLEYNQIPDYVKTNFPNITSKLVENCYDYKLTITNYNQIFDDVSKAKEELNAEGVIQHLRELSK